MPSGPLSQRCSCCLHYLSAASPLADTGESWELWQLQKPLLSINTHVSLSGSWWASFPTSLEVSACRYERSQKQAAFGRSLVQRHVALPEDIANEAGEGLLVSIASCQIPPFGVLHMQHKFMQRGDACSLVIAVLLLMVALLSSKWLCIAGPKARSEQCCFAGASTARKQPIHVVHNVGSS